MQILRKLVYNVLVSIFENAERFINFYESMIPMESLNLRLNYPVKVTVQGVYIKKNASEDPEYLASVSLNFTQTISANRDQETSIYDLWALITKKQYEALLRSFEGRAPHHPCPLIEGTLEIVVKETEEGVLKNSTEASASLPHSRPS